MGVLIKASIRAVLMNSTFMGALHGMLKVGYSMYWGVYEVVPKKHSQWWILAL